MYYQICLSLQVKRSAIIINKQSVPALLKIYCKQILALLLLKYFMLLKNVFEPLSGFFVLFCFVNSQCSGYTTTTAFIDSQVRGHAVYAEAGPRDVL